MCFLDSPTNFATILEYFMKGKVEFSRDYKAGIHFPHQSASHHTFDTKRKALFTAKSHPLGPYAGFIFGHFFGVFFLATTPCFDNVTDVHRNSRPLADFPSRQSWCHFSGSFSRKKGTFDFFLNSKPKKNYTTSSPLANSSRSPWISVTSRDIVEVWISSQVPKNIPWVRISFIQKALFLKKFHSYQYLIVFLRCFWKI